MNEMNSFFNSTLSQTDPEVAAAIHDELVRQQDQIEIDRIGKYCLNRGNGSPGLDSDK